MHTGSSAQLFRAILEGRQPFVMATAGQTRLPQGWRGGRSFTRRKLEDHMLWGLRRGRIRARLPEETRMLEAPRAMWIHGGLPGTFHLPDDCAEADVRFLRFRLGRHGWRLREPFLSGPASSHLLGCFERLVGQHRRPAAGKEAHDLHLRATLVDLLGQILEQARPMDIARQGLRPEQRERCLAFLEANQDRFFSLAELADHCRLNPVYLSAQFKKTFGRSLQSHIKESRIQTAKALLAELPLSVSDVADRLGYCDIYYFSRQFKDVTGESPTQWRARQGSM